MADYSAGSASVAIGPNFDRFVERLRTYLESIDVELEVGVTLALDPAEVSRFEAEVSSRLASLSPTVNVELDIEAGELTRFEAALASSLAVLTPAVNVDLELNAGAVAAFSAVVDTRLAALTPTVTIDNIEFGSGAVAAFSAELDTRLSALTPTVSIDSIALDAGAVAAVSAELNTRLATLSPTVNVTLDVTAAELVRFGAYVNGYLATLSPTVRVNLDIDEAAYRARLAALTASPASQTVNIDVDRNGGLSRGARGAGLVAAAVGLIVPAAGLALGAVAALGAGIGALGIVGAAAISTLAVGLSGVGSAFSALSKAEESAGADGAAQAKAVAAATKQVEQSEKDVQRAKRSSREAEQDLTRARKDAQQQIEDLNLALRGGALSEKDAQLSLLEAKRDLQNLAKDNPNADAIDRERALLRVQQAEQRLLESQSSQAQLAEKTADANRKGVEGSDLVVDAKQRVVDANDQVAQAESAAADAQTALQDAMTSSSAAADKAAQALAKLSPNAREFVLAMRELKPLTADLKNSVQDALFDGLGESFTKMSESVIPALKVGMTGVATSLNGLAKDFSTFWQDAGNTEALQTGFAGAASFIDGIGPGLAQATQGFLSFGQAFAPVAEQVGASVGGLLGNIGAAFTDAFNSGALTELFSNFATIFDGLGEGLRSLIGGFIEFGNIVGPVVGPLLATIGQSFAQLAPAMGQLGLAFGQALISIMPTLTELISALATGLAPVMPVLAELLNAVGSALIPLIGPLSQVAQVVGQALAQAITAIAPAIGPLATAFASMVTAIAPILPLIAQVIGMFVEALAPALTTIFDALAPVIEQMVAVLQPVLEAIAPVLAEVAGMIGDALAQAITALAPLLPPLLEAFYGLVEALLPLLPPLIQIALDLLPVLVQIMQAWLPVITTVIQILTELVNLLMPVLIPVLQTLGDIVGFVFGLIGDTISAAVNNVIMPAVTMIKDNIGSLGEKFGEVKDFIVEKWDALIGFFTGLPDKVRALSSGLWDGFKDGFKIAINWIIEKWNSFAEFMKIPDIPGVPNRGESFLPKIPLLADGGVAGRRADGSLYGPGTGTSDSILGLDRRGIPTAWVSTGEGVVTEAAMNAGGDRVVTAMNAGRIPMLNVGGPVTPSAETDGGSARKWWTDPAQQPPAAAAPAAAAPAPVSPAAAAPAAGGTTDPVAEAELGGGTVNASIWNVVHAKFPDATLNSGYRAGDPGYHGIKKAIDVGGPIQAVADFMFREHKNDLAQIIWNDGPVLYNVRKDELGTGVATAEGGAARDIYGPGTMAGHADHAHIAAEDELPAAPAASSLGGPTATSPASPMIGPNGAAGLPTSSPSTTGPAGLPDGLSAQSIGAKAGTLAANWLLGIFGLEDSILSSSNTLNKTFNDVASASTSPAAPASTAPTPGSVDGLVPSAVPGSATAPAAGKHVYDPRGGAEQWRPTIAAILQATNRDLGDADRTTEQVGIESGGVPDIVQGVIDVNSGGNEAVGLLQIIPGTFAANKDPRYPGDRTDPEANIAAALNYVDSRYNGPSKIWPTRNGYSGGGWASGPGGPTADLIPAMLSDKEFVVHAAAAAANGPVLEAMNAGATFTGPTSSYQPALVGAGASTSTDRSVNYGDVTVADPDAFFERQQREVSLRTLADMSRWGG